MVSSPEQPSPRFRPDQVLFHGSGLLVVDKPAGMSIHEGTGHEGGLVESVARWVAEHPRALDTRPGKRIHPVHLIDREASGVTLLALTRAMARKTKEVFAEHLVERTWLAVVAGPLPEEGELRGKVRSKLRGSYRWLPARVGFRTICTDDRLSLVECKPHEGRTHVIRALFARAGRPLAGDLRYGKPRPSRLFLERFRVPGLVLHAWRLTLPGGILGSRQTFEAPLPPLLRSVGEQKGWQEALAALEGSEPS